MDEETRREMPIPFGTKWYRVENVDLKKIEGKWVFHFSGEVTPYEICFDTYRDFRSLELPMHPTGWIMRWDLPKPEDNVLEFFCKWGPLGFYYMQAFKFVYDEFAQALNDESAFEVEISGSNEWIPLGEYWMKHHTRKIRIGKTRTVFPEADEVFNGYFERWDDIWLQLMGLQSCCYEWESEGDINQLNERISLTSLRPYVVPRDEKKGDKEYQLTFAFSSLCDALVGLIGENAIGEVDMRICENPSCARPFDAIETGRTTYCSPECSRVGPDNKRLQDPVSKYRRMLQRRLERCPEGMVSHEESKAINAELLAAKSQDDLKSIENKKYPDILRKKKGSAK